jgi:hypothetical protein
MHTVVAHFRVDIEIDGDCGNGQRLQQLPPQIHVVLKSNRVDVAVKSVLLSEHPVAEHRSVENYALPRLFNVSKC